MQKISTIKKHFENICNKKLKSFREKRYKFVKDSIKIGQEKIKNFKSLTPPKIDSLQSLFERLQDKIEQSITSDREDVLLQQSPFWAQSITWTLMSGTVLGVGWLGFAKTEEIVVAQGQLEPVSGVIEVQMPFRGVISKVLVKEGDKVKKGQVLLKLDSEVNEARKRTQQESVQINQMILNKLELLVDEGAISELQYLQQKEKVSAIKSQLIESNVNLKYQEIISPASGYVFDLKATGSGYVGNPSEPILKVVPTDNLQAKIEIDSRTIGFVKVGKEAAISIDSYPSTDFGIIKGEVISIGSNALESDPLRGKGIRFPASIKLADQFLKAKNNSKLPLQVGMSLTANVKLRKVSYLQLLLNTFSEKADSLREL